MLLFIQVVTILWTKATRGAPRAQERARLPRVFPLQLPDEGACRVQRLLMKEWDGDFAPQLLKPEALPGVPGTLDEALSIRTEAGGRFLLGFAGTPFGMPRRHPRRDVIALEPGQYARLSINCRHASTSGQYYVEWIFHVSSGDSPPPADRFQRGAPDHELDLKADLF